MIQATQNTQELTSVLSEGIQMYFQRPIPFVLLKFFKFAAYIAKNLESIV
ncbi:hypothetical protein ACP70R_015686 [Stipagrostis hirtigluma subsp. patula]